MIWVFVTLGDTKEITVVKAKDLDKAKILAGITGTEYLQFSLADYDLDTLKSNSEVLLR